MSFWDKENLSKVGSKLKTSWGKAAEKTSDMAGDSVDVATELQIKAVGDKLKQSSATWRAVYVDEMLDGEGGYTVWGKLYPANTSLKIGGLLIGLAHNMKLKHDIALGQPVCWNDVVVDESLQAIRIRRQMETEFA